MTRGLNIVGYEVLETIIKAMVLNATNDCLDLLQFVYWPKEVLMMLNCLSSILCETVCSNSSLSTTVY